MEKKGLFWAQGHPTYFEPWDWLQLRLYCPVVQIQLCNSYVSRQAWAPLLLKLSPFHVSMCQTGNTLNMF